MVLNEARMETSAPVFTFGPFSLDAAARRLGCHGVPVPLRPKTFALLEYFVRNPGRVVTKSEIFAALWPDEDVTEQNLAQHVFLLRGALAAHAPGQAFLVTEPGRGYRFVARTRIVAARRRVDSEVERLTLRGWYHWEKRSAAGYARAREFFERALERDRDDAPAWAGLADTYLLRCEYLLDPPEPGFPLARDAARTALALAPDLPSAHAVLGDVALFYERDYGEAERRYAAALAADPRYLTARMYRAWFHNVRGRRAEALLDVEAALEDAPYDLNLLTTRGTCALWARDFRDAAAQFRLVLDLEPGYRPARHYLGIAQTLAGEHRDALETLSADQAPEREQINLAVGAFAARRAGLGDVARDFERQLADMAARGTFVSAFNRALPPLGQGDVETCVGILETGLAARDPWLVFVAEYPLFDDARASRRFAALRERIARGDV